MTANVSLKLGDANLIKKDTNYENEKKKQSLSIMSHKKAYLSLELYSILNQCLGENPVSYNSLKIQLLTIQIRSNKRPVAFNILFNSTEG